MSICVICKFSIWCRVQTCLLDCPCVITPKPIGLLHPWSLQREQLRHETHARNQSAFDSCHNFSVVLRIKTLWNSMISTSNLQGQMFEHARFTWKSSSVEFRWYNPILLEIVFREKNPDNWKTLADLKQMPLATTALSPFCKVFAICSLVIDHKESSRFESWYVAVSLHIA